MTAEQSVKPPERQLVLEERRNLKMAKSAESFVRGTTFAFYKWLESTNGRSVPDGPPVWICGDCHVGNLGPVANSKGQVEIAIRDLDQTVIGNPSHDLIRLGLSLAMAARGSDLPGVITAKIIEQLIEGYDKALSHRSLAYKDFERPTELFKVVLKQAGKRKWHQLAQDWIEDDKPHIYLGKRFWPLSQTEKKEIERLFETEQGRKLVTCLHNRKDDAK